MKSTYRIAIVEDHDSDYEQLSRCLLRYGEEHEADVQITRYISAEAAVDGHRCNHDMLFFDIQLGGMDGMEAARQIREKDPSCIIVFVTNMVQYAVTGYIIKDALIQQKKGKPVQIILAEDLEKTLFKE